VTVLFHTIIACATCFGDPESSQTHGMNMAILTLLGITGVVLSSFGAAIYGLARREKQDQLLEKTNDVLQGKTDS